MVTYSGPGGIQVEELGEGERVILVHGGGMSGADAWRPQLGLAAQYQLVIPTRLGYPNSPPTAREDFDVDARHIAELIGEGAHLVGHSYGAVVAMLAARLRRDAVRSLTVIDAACSAIARGAPVVDAYEADMQRLVSAPPADPGAFVRAVFRILDAKLTLPDPLPPPLVAFGRRLYTLRWPWEAEVPLEELRQARFPKLVISGGRNPLYEVIGDALQRGIGARRFVIAGAGHHFENDAVALTSRIASFLSGAE